MSLNQAIEVTENVFWVGSHYPESCPVHAYLIKDNDNSVLIDPPPRQIESCLNKLKHVLSLKDVRYIIVQHHHDHLLATIQNLQQELSHQQLTFIIQRPQCSFQREALQKSIFYFLDEHDYKVGDSCGIRLEFIATPYCHAPNAFVSYDPQSQVLFSSDLFGCTTGDLEFYATANYFEQVKTFHASYIPGKDILHYSLAKIEQLKLKLIAPRHGSLIREQYIEQLIHNMKQLDCGIYIDEQYTQELMDVIEQLENSKQELSRQHRFLQNVIDGTHDPLMVILPDYRVSLMNAVLKKNLIKEKLSDPDNPKCYEVAYLRNQPCHGDNMPCPLRDVLTSGKVRNVTHQFLCQQGHCTMHELTATPLFDDQGKVYAIVESSHDVTDHKKKHDTLQQLKVESEHKATHDELTGLPNKRLLFDRLNQAIAHARRENTRFALLFIDLDNFKPINDTLGHQAGDSLLQEIARRYQKTLRKVDTIARFGGDEFVILVNDLKQREDIKPLIDKLISVTKEPVVLNRKKANVSASIGVSIYPDDAEDAASLLHHADCAMYMAKDMNRDGYHFYMG